MRLLDPFTAHAAAGGSGSLDTTAFTADNLVSGGNSEAYVEFNTSGTATLVGNQGTSPASPRWWSTTPPATWLEFSSTGTGNITGGLTAGTRYEINAARKIGNQRTFLGTASRTFTVSFYDAATGGTLLGTKTVTLTAERA